MLEEYMRALVGVDIGGSHITSSLIDLSNDCVIQNSRVRNAVNTHGSKEEILSVWTENISAVISHVQHDLSSIRIGIAMPGPFNYQDGISYIQGMNKLESLYKTNIRTALSSSLGIPGENFIFMNDAEAFLFGEANCGSVKGLNKVLGLTLGTGLGSAVYHHGSCLDANLGISSFRDGIVEDYLSTRWFVAKYKILSGNTIKDARAVLEAPKSDRFAVAIFQEFIENLTEFVFRFINLESPQAVVLGGNISRAFPTFSDQLNKNLLNRGTHVPVVASKLWEDAAMIGVACSWNKKTLLNNCIG